MEQQSFRGQLESWHGLVVRERQLALMISRQEDRLAQLRDRLSPSGILGAFQHAPLLNADIRPGGGHGDKVLTLVADTEEEAKAITVSLSLLRIEWQDIGNAIREIDDVVALLSDLQRQLLTLYYRERYPWSLVCRNLAMSRAGLYRLLDAAIATRDER